MKGQVRFSGVKRSLICVIFALAARGTAAGADFGLVLSGTGEYLSRTGSEGAGFTGSFTPWFSAALPRNLGLYVSGKAAFEYTQDGEGWERPLFELDRTKLSFRPHQAVYAAFGRQRYQDSSGMIVSGLFDGLSSSIGFSWARVSLGAFYTGFLYKGAADILMTAEDRDQYLAPLDYGDPGTYFASRRILLPLDIEFPDLASRLSLALTALAQIDVNDAPKLHTQYLTARFGFEAADTLRLGLTGTGALAEYEGAEVKANFAAAFTAGWDLPGALTDMLSAELRWGSGAVSEKIIPFLPVSTIVQGGVFTPSLQGLMKARAAYTARLHRTVSFSLETSAFWRTDVETFMDPELNGASKDRFLGSELYGSLTWAPQSALRLTARGGMFLPGGAFAENAGKRWNISAGIIVSL
jgi:hypothetical protein